MVLPEHSHVGVVVHTLGLLWERLRHVGAAAKMLPNLLSPPQGPLRLVFALALVGEPIAVAAQEPLARPVKKSPSCRSSFRSLCLGIRAKVSSRRSCTQSNRALRDRIGVELLLRGRHSRAG